MKLYQHQQDALKQTEGFQNVAFFHDMGLGKTYTGSEAMFRYGCKPNLIICQKSKVKDWVNHLKQYKVQVFDLTSPKQLDEFAGLSAGFRFTVVGVINYELAWRRKKDLLNLENFTLMLDESSLIQNPKAKQTKFILKLHPEHVILLSGSPVGGKYENLWTQCHLLGWKITENAFNKTYINWTKIQIGGMVHRVVDRSDPYRNTDRMKQKMRDHGAVFLKTEDVMNLPEQIFTTVHVDKSKEYSKFMKNRVVTVHTGVYDHLIDHEWDGKTYDDLHELVGDMSLTKLLYARQLCGHFNRDKLEAFRDLIQSTQDRVVVFYNFNAELDALKKICQEEGKPISEINGHTKDLTAYEKDSDSITLCQYQSGSMGLNLQKANRIIYFTLPLSSEHFEQSKKRIHRIGQNKTCFYYLMICRGTVEEQILKTLEERKDFTDALFEEFHPDSDHNDLHDDIAVPNDVH